jgi:hypothetical protein
MADVLAFAPKPPPPLFANIIPYANILQRALGSAVRDILLDTATHGLPGEHYFLLTFATQAAGVGLSSSLREQHPQELTIVLQYSFDRLKVDAEGFDAELWFDGTLEHLRVPFAALISFYDPSVPFGFNTNPLGGGQCCESVQ